MNRPLPLKLPNPPPQIPPTGDEPVPSTQPETQT